MKRKYIVVHGETIFLDEHEIKEEVVKETPKTLVERYVANPKDKSGWWIMKTEFETRVFFFKEDLNVPVDELVEAVEDYCEVHKFTDDVLTHGGTFDELIVVCFPKEDE